MKKQKFEVGQKIAIYDSHARHIDIVKQIHRRDILTVEGLPYYYSFKQCRRIVKKKKPVEKIAAREFWIDVESPQKGWLHYLKGDARVFGGRWVLVKEVLDEEGGK